MANIEEEHLSHMVFFSNYCELTQQRAEEMFALDDTWLFLEKAILDVGYWKKKAGDIYQILSLAPT